MFEIFNIHQQYSELSIQYTDRISNWKIDPIYEIYKKDVCDTDSEDFFDLQNGAATYNKWINSNQNFGLCLRRLKDYNFVQKYSIYPQCLETEQLCGGVYVENKYCAPIGQCPINSIKFVTSDELKSIDTTKYTINIQINTNFYLVASTNAESLPINQIEIFGTTPCLQSQFTNYQTIFSQAYCENDSSYTLLNQIDEMTYATANGFTSNTADKVGVYSRSYIQQTIECRQRSLITWGQRTLVDDDSLYAVISVLMVSSAINFGVTGFVQTLYYFLQVQYQATINKGVDKSLLIIKILSSYFNAIMITLAFSLEMDIKLFLQLSSNLNCSDTQTQSIINDQLNNMNSEWRYSFIIFILFVSFVLFECVAFSICVDKKLKRKIEPKFRQITFSNSNISQISNKNDNNQNLYLYFKPLFQTEQNNDFNLQQALNLKQIDQSEFPNQENQDPIQSAEPSASMQQSNSIERSPQQSQQNSLKIQDNIENRFSKQKSQQQPYMAVSQNQQTIFNQTNFIPPEDDLNNFISLQKPIQKPSIKYDIEDQIQDDEIKDQKHKVNK